MATSKSRLNNGGSSTQIQTELVAPSATHPVIHSNHSTCTNAIRTPQTWRGNNTYGRIVGGPQKRNFFYTLILIIIPSILFICFVCLHFIVDHSMYYPLIIYLFLMMIVLISLTLTFMSDPGIIPRNVILSNAQDYKGPIHLKQRLLISGKLHEIKWCGTCKIFRPSRSFHCYICNNCVERFDHHCPWIGNCIGLRNYAYFSLFVNSLQLLCVWVIFHCVYIMHLRSISPVIVHHTNWKRFVYICTHEYMAFIVGIYVFVAVWFVLGLTVFHWFLVLVGKTTNEQVLSSSNPCTEFYMCLYVQKLRNLHPVGSPYKRSLFGNIIDICCRLPPSSVHLHHKTPPVLNDNEIYINKQKIILLDDESVRQHKQKKNVNGCSHIQMTKQNEEEEENKYDPSLDSKSKSRKDEHANQDELYSYEEEEEEEEEEDENENQLELTPRTSSMNELHHRYHGTPEPLMAIANNNNLAIKIRKNEKQTTSPTLSKNKISVPSDSPISLQGQSGHNIDSSD